MNKKFKGFFNWTLRHDGGFTLVELIVVIAILAILAGVAIPAYSGYVTKANITADENLASEVENALILYYYSNPGTTGGWVALTSSGAMADDSGIGAEAMKAVFGESWASTAALKHNGWKMTGGFDPTMMYAVENSGFKTESLNSTLGQVQKVVEKASKYLDNNLVGATMDQSVVDIMAAAGVVTDGTLTTGNAQAAANAYFYVVAGELSNIDTLNTNDGSKWSTFLDSWKTGSFDRADWETGIVADAAQYASALAFANYMAGKGNTTYLNRLENYQGADPRDEATAILNEVKNGNDWKGYKRSEASTNDAMAFLGYMQGVNTSEESLLKNLDLNSTQYFTDGNIASFVDSYLEIGKALDVAGVNNGIVVSIDRNGKVAVQKGKN